MKRIIMLVTVVVLMGVTAVIAAAPAEAAPTQTVRYGPFTIPAASGDVPGTLERVRFGVAKPCQGQDCYITGFKPNLIYPDGSTANVGYVDGMHTGVMLHHALFTNQWRPDATCGTSRTLWGLAGERFFASGNERTAIAFPDGYGYRVRSWDSWNMLVDLMNHEAEPKTVYVEVTYTLNRNINAPVKPLKPVWLDTDNCGDSEYSIPAGYSDTHWDWNVNVPGKVVAAAGHVHGHGIAVEATNESKGGASICRSEATLHPTDVHSVLSMSTCTGDPLARVQQGETVRLHSEYNSTHPADDVMGIMLLYISRE